MVASNSGVKLLVVAETSRPEVLDWHLNQYFTEHLHIAPPSVPDKESILKGKGFDLVSDQRGQGKGFDLVSDQRGRKGKGFDLAKSMSDFDPNLQSCYDDDDPPKLMITTEDLIKAVKLVTPSLKRQGFPVIPDITWADIGGLDLAKKELRDSILKPIKDPEYSSNFGLGENSGVLLWGPPGCGKTLLAKAVANEAGVNLLTVSGPELLSMYQGESERAVREVFARAESVAPCVIFFDEFDSLCPRRSKTGSESGSKSTIVNMLLTEMDGFLARPGIYLIAATNLPALLDPAVLRPGRFETKLYVGLPSVQGRVAVLRATTKNGTMPRLASDVDLDAIAKREECENFTGADCKNLVTLAKKIARDEHELKVRELEAVAASNPTASDHSDGESGTKKRKRNDSVDADSRPAKVVAGESARPALDCYPEGEFLLYSRHFDAAFDQVEPSVLEEDLLRKVGEPVRKVGEPVRKVGEPVRKVGEPVRKVGEPVRKLEEPVRKLGKVLACLVVQAVVSYCELSLQSDADGFTVTYLGRLVLDHSTNSPIVSLGSGNTSYEEYSGNFDIEDNVFAVHDLGSFVFVDEKPELVHITLSSNTSQDIGAEVIVEVITGFSNGSDSVEIHITPSITTPASINRLWFRLYAEKHEKVFGAGEQYTYFNLRGRDYPIWTREQGVGRGDGVVTNVSNAVADAGGAYHTTYWPQSSFFSSRLYSALVNNLKYVDQAYVYR
ncbi:ATPase AAA-type core [Trinorchestia longiramus]|nr:ATPase AAA-type core [Trinorchestia longiramus]